MALVDENQSMSEGILVSSSVTEGAWGPGVGDSWQPSASCLRGSVPQGNPSQVSAICLFLAIPRIRV